MQSPLGSYVQVRGGHRIYLDNPDFSPMSLEDLALSLAHINRWAGNADKQISVLAHSYIIAKWLQQRGHTPWVCLAGLLHDAPEIVTNDIPAPIKRYCGPEFVLLEERLQRAVFLNWGVNIRPEEMHWVKEADTRIMADEQRFCRSSVTDNDWLEGILPLTRPAITGFSAIDAAFFRTIIGHSPTTMVRKFVRLYETLI